MRQYYLIFIFFLYLFLSCKKDNKNNTVETPVIPLPVDTSIYACKDLPAGPLPFGWRDSTTDENKNINTFMYNPANLDEIIYVVNGDILGYNKMYCYNVPTKKTTYLASISDFPPQINKYGWILYSTNENNVYKVKSNGDSIKQLTYNNLTKDPKWDYTERSFYFFQSANNTSPPRLAKFDGNGFPLLNFDLEMPYTATFKKSNKIIYLKTNVNSISLILRDLTLSTERILLTTPYSAVSNYVYFDNLTLDNNDENAYWSNTNGIIKCNLSSLKVDTLFKNCQNIKYDNPIFQSAKPNSMFMTCHIIKNINAFQLLHTYMAVEYNIISKDRTEIKIFP